MKRDLISITDFSPKEVEQLMSDETARLLALGWLDATRMNSDYELVRTYVGIEQPFDVQKHFTNDFLDQSIKMKAVKF